MNGFMIDGPDFDPPPQMVLKPGCEKWHNALPELGYTAAIEDAEERLGKKEKQIVCPSCRLYVWTSFFHTIPVEDEFEYKRIGKRTLVVVGIKKKGNIY